jgi:myo-inositol-1(or 4)-monophosphatase
MNEILQAAVEIARGAGKLLADAYSRGDSAVGHKSTLIDLVTDADKAAEAYILQAIRKRFPDHAVLAEESGTVVSDGPWRWIVDPLDGTVNFAHGIPHFAVLLAAQERRAHGDFDTVVGVTFDPLREELFTTARGQGATLNGRTSRVSATPRLIDSIGATGFMYDRLFRAADNHPEFCRLNLLTQGVRRTGSAGLDLAYVACGRFDFFWEYSLNPWDLAGGALMLTEAGGRITNLGDAGLDIFRGQVLASNGLLHESADRALASCKGLPTGSREGLELFLPPELVEEIARKRSG